jgi:hypothetical protein
MAPFFCPTKPPDLRTHHQPAQSTYENTGKKLRILTGTNSGSSNWSRASNPAMQQGRSWFR